MARGFLLFALALVLFGCEKKASPSHDQGGHGGGHVHTAPHGGTLVELGDHAYNLELVRDAASGKLSVYILDGHAENFVRIKAPSFALNAKLGADTRGLLLQAVANTATGETVGDTSQFEAQAEWLKAAAGFEGVIPALEIRGTRFENIAVRVQ